MPRTNEVGFRTNIPTPGRKSVQVREGSRRGARWRLASGLGARGCTGPLARPSCSSLESVSEKLSLLLSGQRFQFKPEAPLLVKVPARPCLPSQSHPLCLALRFQEGVGLVTTMTPQVVCSRQLETNCAIKITSDS